MRSRRQFLLLILILTATTVRADSFEFFADPVPSSWASFAFDADGDNLACNYGGHIFRWSPSTGFQDLGEGHPQSGSIGITADGTTICVTRVRPEDGYLNPALWSENEGWVDLGYTLDGCVVNDSWGSGFDLSDDGTQAVGLAWTCQGGRAFHWTVDGGMTGLAHPGPGNISRATAIAGNGSLVVGFLEHPQHGFRRPVLWRADDYHPLLYAGLNTRGEALAVITSGTMVAGYHLSSQVEQAHYWTETEGLVPLGTLSRWPWDTSRATHITDNGTVFGTSTHTIRNVTEAFSWDSFDGMVRLQDLLRGQGAMIPANMWLDGVLAVSSNATRLLGSWRDAQGGRGHWMAEVEFHQKGRVQECLASTDGSRLELSFELLSSDSLLRPILVANRGDRRWEVPVHFQGRTCRGIDHQANLDPSGEVVYELILASNGQPKVLERFSIWIETLPAAENTLTGSLMSRTLNNYALHFRIQQTDHLVISGEDETGRVITPLSDRVFESGYHGVSWNAQEYRGSGRDPGREPERFIHIQWQ